MNILSTFIKSFRRLFGNLSESFICKRFRIFFVPLQKRFGKLVEKFFEKCREHFREHFVYSFLKSFCYLFGNLTEMFFVSLLEIFCFVTERLWQAFLIF